MNVDCVWHVARYGGVGGCEGKHYARPCDVCGVKFMGCALAHSEHDTCWTCVAYPLPKQEEPKEVTG